MKYPKKIRNILAAFFCLVIVLVPLVSSFEPHIAQAAASDSPTANGGDYFLFYYADAVGTYGAANAIQICQGPSASAVTVANCNKVNYAADLTVITPSGQTTSPPTTYEFSGSADNNGADNITVDVLDSNPSGNDTATYTLNNGNKYDITVNGYAAALAAFTKAGTAETGDSGVVAPTPVTGTTPQSINVTSVIDASSADTAGQSIPAITYDLNTGSTVDTTTQSTDGTFQVDKSDKLSTIVETTVTGTFTGIAPGNYTISSPQISASPVPVTVSNTTATAELDGTYIDSAAATNDNTTCETSGSPLTWILCPVFNMVSDFSQWALQNIVQPFLITPPVSVDPSNGSFQAWSQFRTYGDIVLVIALLVIVFGEVIGGGIVDAYTAKKMLPRLLIAAILINLSVYIVAALVDISNVAGQGISNLLIEPYKAAGLLNFTINGTQQVGVFGVGILGAFLGSASAAGFIFSIFTGGAAIALEVAFFLILPLILGALGVFVTLIARQGIILFLVIVSPIAFALYCLPNTEQYFKRWWKLLAECLLVYPIVMAIFAVSDILSMTILQANGVNLQAVTPNGFQAAALDARQIIAVVVAFALQFMPLLAAPFAFRIAGGTLGKLHELVTAGGAQINKLAEGRKEQSRQRYNTRAIQGRDRGSRAIYSFADRHRSLRPLARFAGNRVAGYNIEGALSGIRAEQMKNMQAQNDTGDDTEERALTVNKAWALSHGRQGTDWRTAADGSREFRTLGGRWVSEGAVDNAQSRWSGDLGAMQWALGHEMEKANTQEEQDYLRTNFGNVAGGWNMSAGQTQGLWQGAAFAKQNVNRQWKHYNWNGDAGDLNMNALGMMTEIDEKQGNYAMMQQNADTWTTMSQAMQRSRELINSGGGTDAERAEATEVLQRGARIAFATRSGSMASSVAGGEEEGGPPAGVRVGGGREVGAGAAGRVQEEMIRFVNMSDSTIGVYTPPAGDPTLAGGAPAQVPPGGLNDTVDRRGTDRPGPTGTGPRTS